MHVAKVQGGGRIAKGKRFAVNRIKKWQFSQKVLKFVKHYGNIITNLKIQVVLSKCVKRYEYHRQHLFDVA